MRRLFLLLGVLVLLVAAFLRLWQLHQYPPGPHYDEAVYLLITRSIAFGGARPFPIVEAYQGREVLYMYLDAPLLRLLGDRIFTLHVSNAFYNLITIAASMALGRVMFAGRRGLVVGLAAGALMALSFPQIWLGRQAFRAVTLPLCQALALLFLWRGLNARRGGWGWLITGGVFAGAALYTYMASRLFPFWLLIAGVALLLWDRQRRGFRLRQGLVFFGVLTLVALPMAIYALREPDIFLGRLAEVTREARSVTLAESVVLHARMFFLEGDPYLRYNIPGRPYFTWLEGIFLLVGIAVCVWRLTHRGRATERAGYLLALLSPLMVIPSVISVGGLPPSHMRSLGMVPLIFILVAVGVEVVVARLAAWRQASAPVSARRYAGMVAAAMISVLVIGGMVAGGTYFSWARRADLYYEADADLAAAASWLPGQVDDATVVYVAARDRGHPTLTIEHGVPPVTWLGTDSVVRAPEGREGLYIFPRSAPPPDEWLAWLEPGRLTDLPLGPDGRTAFEAFRLDGTTPLPPIVTPAETVENAYLALQGVHATDIVAGDRANVATAWEILQPPPAADLTPILEVIDDYGNLIARADVYMAETDRWRPGEVLMQRIAVEIPAGTPPGDYPLRMAWVAKSSETYVPYTSGGIWAEVGRVTVERATDADAAALPIAVRQEVAVAPGIRLFGWNPPPENARPGENLPITLFWQATADAPEVPALAAILSGVAGETVIASGVPGGDYPPSAWASGEVIAERARWTVPREQQPGDYQLLARVGESEMEIGRIEIGGVARLMEAPEVEQRLDAQVGDAFLLYGYTVDAPPNECALNLTLVWQARLSVDREYTVFVHLVDAEGNIVAQRDVAPQEGTYPVTLWQPGEYVVDFHGFGNLPPGEYRGLIGFYSQATGERLPVLQNGEPPENRAIQIALPGVYC